MAAIHTSVSVGTAVVSIVPAAGENYQFIAVSNHGPDAAYLKMVPSTTTLTVSNGVKLAPGGTVLVDQDVTPILVGGISAVCDTGDSAVVAVQAY